MIIGYFPISIENTNYVYDYVAEKYPEGNLTSHKTIYFNKQDIQEVLHKGYTDDACVKFMEQATKMSLMFKEKKDELTDKNSNVATSSSSNVYQFDKNGRVLMEATTKLESKPMPLYQFDENGVVVADHSATEKEKLPNLEDVSNPFALTEAKENAEVEKDTKKWPIFKSIKFDQNGVVLAAEEY